LINRQYSLNFLLPLFNNIRVTDVNVFFKLLPIVENVYAN